MINTISYFSPDSFEGVKPAAGDPAEFAAASGFAALMNVPAPAVTQVRVAGPEDPAESGVFSSADPEAGSGEGQTGGFFPDQSEEGTPLPQPGTPTISISGGLCYDGTPWHPILKKDYGLDVISNRRQIADTPVNPVRLPPVENPSNDAPRDPAKKDDFGIRVIADGRPIVDPTVVPVRQPPVDPAANTKPDVKAAIKLPPHDALWDDGSTREPDGKKDFNLGIFTHQRPVADPAVTPVRLPPVDPASTTKPDAASEPVKTSPGSNPPVKLPPREALRDDGSTRDPKEMKKSNLGIFNRIRSIVSTQPTVYQVVPAVLGAPADPAQPSAQPAVDGEPGLPAMSGEFHLPTDLEIGPGVPASLPETAPDQAATAAPGIEVKVEETPLLVRPRPVVDPAAVKLTSAEPGPNPAKPGIKYAPIGDTPSPVKLPPRDGLWDDGTARDTGGVKKFNLGVFNRRRPVTNTEPRAAYAADLTDVAVIDGGAEDAATTVAAIRANKWLEQLTGQKLPQPPAQSPSKAAGDIEPGPPVMPEQSRMPEANQNIKTVPATGPAPEETPLLVRPRPIVDAVAGSEKPLLRQPFQPVTANGTDNGEKDDHRANLGQLFREVSGSFESGGHGALKSVVAGTEDIINEIAGRSALKSVVAGTADIINEIGGYLTEVDTAAETGIDALDPMDAQFEKLWQPEPVAPKAIIKTDAGTPALRDASEILDQVKPGLLELAALAAKKNEKQSMKMRLHPAELGAVEISLERNSSGTLSAHFKTENEAARQALTNNLDQLRDSLQKSGWQVGQLDVSGNSSSPAADQNREHGSRRNDVAEDPIFNRRSPKPEDLEQDSSSRLLNLRA